MAGAGREGEGAGLLGRARDVEGDAEVDGGGYRHGDDAQADVDLRLAADEASQRLVEDEDAAGADKDRLCGGSDALRFAVAVRVLQVGGLGGKPDAPEVERGGADVLGAVDGVGEDGDAAGDQPDDELEHEDDAVGDDGDDGRAGGTVAEEGRLRERRRHCDVPPSSSSRERRRNGRHSSFAGSGRGADASCREGEHDQADDDAEPERREADDQGGEGGDALAHPFDDDLQQAGDAALRDAEAARRYEDDGARERRDGQDEGGLKEEHPGPVVAEADQDKVEGEHFAGPGDEAENGRVDQAPGREEGVGRLVEVLDAGGEARDQRARARRRAGWRASSGGGG